MTTVTAAMAAILLCGPAFSDEATDRMCATLLATPVWTYEWGQRLGTPDPHGAAGRVQTGKVSFVEKDGKLIGVIDVGLKCDNEVTLRADGFDLASCVHGANSLQYVRSGNEFKAAFGSQDYTIRPAP
jgi:hypothetical protein